MEPLTPRQKQILRVIALEHIASTQPVGSEQIVRRHSLGASSATIRNEMNVLEAMGLIRQPHTSAGRIPTARGYRYFVDVLLDEAELPPAEQRLIRHQFHQIELDTQRWHELTASLLARYVGALAVVTLPHSNRSRLKHLELVGINDSLVLMVAVLHDGTVVQHLVSPAEPTPQERLRETSNRLTELFAGKTAATIPDARLRLTGLDKRVAETLIKLLRQVDEGTSRPPRVAGVANVLAQPEFMRSDRARDIVELAESGALVQQLPPLVTSEGVHTVIGDENPIEALHDTGLVMTRYGAPDDVGGMLAVLGPTRMPYWRAITTLRYLRLVLDELLQELHPYDSERP